MEPLLSKNDINLFYKYLDNSKIYFEFGSGGSTYQASIRKNIKQIYSVESDKIWYDKMKNIIKNDNFRYIYNEMDSQPDTWGSVGKKCKKEQMLKYSDSILSLSVNEQKSIDLILIDGRFRVACCLKSYKVINDNCIIIIDDFYVREKYFVILDFFDVIEHSEDKRMVVLKKKLGKNPDKLISIYELIQD